MLTYFEGDTYHGKYTTSGSGRLQNHLAGSAGKRGGAVELSTNATTQGLIEHSGITSTVLNVLTSSTESDIIDLFDIGANEENGRIGSTKPFRHRVHFRGPRGEVVRVWANIDDGAMKEVMSSETFNKVKHKLGTWRPSSQLLRVANGVIIQSEVIWEGEIEVKGVQAKVAFEVFDSGGRWDFLFGKTLLETFKAIHDYDRDEITISGNGGRTTLCNQTHTTSQHQPPATSPVCVVTNESQHDDEEQPSEISIEAFQGNNKLFTRLDNPFKPERVEEVLRLVTIGDDLSPDQRQKVQDLVRSFVDIFALSVNEVKVADNATHRLDIPKDATFSMKVHQRPLTPPQRKYLYESIDMILEAGVIEPCKPEEVKCISPTTLAQKAHQGNYNTELTTSASPMEWNPDLTCHREQPQPQKTTTKNPNGGFAKTSRKLTRLQK